MSVLTDTDRIVAKQVIDGLEGVKIVGLAAGDCHTMAFDTSGKVYGWGSYREKVTSMRCWLWRVWRCDVDSELVTVGIGLRWFDDNGWRFSICCTFDVTSRAQHKRSVTSHLVCFEQVRAFHRSPPCTESVLQRFPQLGFLIASELGSNAPFSHAWLHNQAGTQMFHPARGQGAQACRGQAGRPIEVRNISQCTAVSYVAFSRTFAEPESVDAECPHEKPCARSGTERPTRRHATDADGARGATSGA